MAREDDAPQISLTRPQWVRLIVVGVFVAFVVARVAADGVRVAYPLSLFGYVTNGDGVIDSVSGQAKKPDPLRVGDRIRIDHIPPDDRKPGIVGESSFSYDNPQRKLPVDRSGIVRIIHVNGTTETVTSRVLAVLRILLFVLVVALGAILYLVQPSIATAAIFAYCLGAEFMATYIGIVIPNPWRQIPEWIAAVLVGAARPALLLFACCLVIESPRVQRAFAIAAGAIAFVLGNLNAFADWRLTYAAIPARGLVRVYEMFSQSITALTILVFVAAFVRARGVERQRIGWIVVAFALASGARLASDQLFPRYLTPWENGVLLAIVALPIAVVWLAVVRQNFFNVDFVVSRAVVYVALTAAVVGTISVSEEIGTYIFYQNTDLAYGFLIAISMGIGSLTGKIREFLSHLVDRFIFRDRHAQRVALESICGTILDAESDDIVYRALLQEAAHALELSFGGILKRGSDDYYELTYNYNWPGDCVVKLSAKDDLTCAIVRSRGAMTFTASDTRLIKKAFPTERLCFAAPLFFDRSVSAIVVFGHNVSGLDLDGEERELLVRIIAHASIALNAIELERYRSGRSDGAAAREAFASMANALVTVESETPKRIG
jgi:hypothetical protein